jgi:MFS family permease
MVAFQFITRANVAFLVFTILSTEAKSMGMLVAARFLAGAFDVAVITCGSGSIADMMPPERRGGPVAGGFLVTTKGWRWVFWVFSILVSSNLLNATLYTLHYPITNPLIGRCHYSYCSPLSEGNVCPGITGAEGEEIEEGD